MSLFAFFSLFLLDKYLVVSCLGWIWPVKCFERFASCGIILGNGPLTHSTTLRAGYAQDRLEMAEKLPDA